MFPLLFTPIGKILTVTLAFLVIGGGAYWKISRDADERARARLQAEELKRLSDAVRAGDAVDVGPDGLFADDGHRRD